MENKLMSIVTTYYKDSKEEFIKDLMEILNHEEVSKAVTETFLEKIDELQKSKTTLKEIIPPIIINSLKVYVYNNKDEIINFIKKALQDEKVKLKIKCYIKDKVISNMNSMVAKFINADIIYNKIMEGILAYLEDPNSSLEMVNTVCNGIDSLMNKSTSEVLVYLPMEGKKQLIESMFTAFIKDCSDEDKVKLFLNNLINRLE